ncbi:MAG: hypothetical protein A3A57_00300 [Candidatus Woykebacteria bacterium RIFCSPLOWO2_01_FULL_41_12]|uniref:Uncharacterized protein n=1 Tax=Candidatus Woykebacteria bacterium RIFCSPLOWO2_01_FULL_41_12 TaxID=1802604 RepID=A0A1G1WS01_9BACT|nr:MAG: hypothetical protein A3A57_00300 [Candidatus Woykebacteria bacterium RIFCSPLOWO2_01_FULL_41_12]
MDNLIPKFTKEGFVGPNDMILTIMYTVLVMALITVGFKLTKGLSFPIISKFRPSNLNVGDRKYRKKKKTWGKTL